MRESVRYCITEEGQLSRLKTALGGTRGNGRDSKRKKKENRGWVVEKRGVSGRAKGKK